MRSNDLLKILEEYAPIALSNEYCKTYDAYDNSGILLDSGEEIKKILFVLDASTLAVQQAIKIGANAIVSHHPVIYGKIGSITQAEPLGRALTLAMKNGISILSMHLNMDTACGGIDEWLACGLGGKVEEMKILEPLQSDGCGYGRVYPVQSTTVKELRQRVAREFRSERVICYLPELQVKKVASFCGAGATESAVASAKREGANVVVSSDFKHHIILQAVEEGIGVIALPHYTAEVYGFEKIYAALSRKVGVESEFFRDERFM